MKNKKKSKDRIEYYNDKGELHREDGPAIEYNNGTKHWYINNQLHRIDGPAIEHSDGSKYWFKNGKRHREDGPYNEYNNEVDSIYHMYFLEDIFYTEEQYKEKILKIKLDRLKSI